MKDFVKGVTNMRIKLIFVYQQMIAY